MPSDSTAHSIIRSVARPTDSPCLMRLGHQRPRDTLAGSAGIEVSAALGVESAEASLSPVPAAVPPLRQKEGKRCPVSPERTLPVLPAGVAVVVAALGGAGALASGGVLLSAISVAFINYVILNA